MKFVAFVSAVVAAVAVGGAHATPSSFWTNHRLEPAAASIAGKHVTVNCTTSIAALHAIAAGNSVPDLQGWTPTTGANVVYLSPLTCAYLDAWLNGKKPANLYGVAGSMLTLAHEAEHAKGLADETDTDCAALHAMPRMVTKYFPLKKRESLHDLMFDAYRGHSTAPAQYQTHAC